MKDFILKGNILYSKDKDKIEAFPDSYLVCVEGKSAGVFRNIPEIYKSLPVKDCGNKLIIPTMTDLHVHAPQYAFRGTGMDMELLEWLQSSTFPEEARYENLDYAEKAYDIFVEDMKRSATSHACIFATRHKEATCLLMEKLEKSGLHSFVGKVNMDRDAPDDLVEKSAEVSMNDTLSWLECTFGKFENTKPMLTPRFLPCCTNELLSYLEDIRRKYSLPVQSHLSENMGEIELVSKLFPETEFYAQGYDEYSLLGRDNKNGESFKTVMAHCVYSGEAERALLKKNGVFIAHCPTSNTDLSSGIAPIKRYLKEGMKTGLGSDVAGGHTLSIFDCIVHSVQVSKLYFRLKEPDLKPLTFEEAFFMGTEGGGEFFGKVGSFRKDYEFNALILDDLKVPCPHEMTIRDRLERAVYLSLDRNCIEEKYVCGNKII